MVAAEFSNGRTSMSRQGTTPINGVLRELKIFDRRPNDCQEAA